MATLDTLLTWQESTGIRYLKDRTETINEGVQHSYTRSRMYSHGSMESFFRHGNRIRDRIFFRPEDTFLRIDPDEEVSYTRTQPGTDWEIPYSIGFAHVVFNEFELDLNASNMKPEHLAHIFKDVWTQKWQNFYTGLCNTLDTEDWAAPDATTMEVTTANSRAPYSWPVFVNEYYLGLPGQESDGSGSNTALASYPGGAWTTVMNINPGTTAAAIAETDGKWDCQRIEYAFAHSGATTPNTTEIFNKMSRLYHQCTFDTLPMQTQYSEKKSSPVFIATQLQGIINFEDALRTNQDYFRGMGMLSGQDPAYPGPSFMGVALERISKLETAVIYPNTVAEDGTLTTFDDTANDAAASGLLTVESGNDPFAASTDTTPFGHSGPRYYFLNLAYLKCLWHANHYIKPKDGWITLPNRPWERIKILTVMNNNVCQSRIRHGILFPDGGTTGASVESA